MGTGTNPEQILGKDQGGQMLEQVQRECWNHLRPRSAGSTARGLLGPV